MSDQQTNIASTPFSPQTQPHEEFEKKRLEERAERNAAIVATYSPHDEKIDPNKIAIPPRVRSTDEHKTRALRSSIRESGITHPILVRKNGDALEVVDGAHRLAVARNEGMIEVACRVFDNMTDAEARKVEIDSLLFPGDLSAAERIYFLGKRRDLYKSLYGDNRGGDRFHGENKPTQQEFFEDTCAIAKVSDSLLNQDLSIFEKMSEVERKLLAKDGGNLTRKAVSDFANMESRADRDTAIAALQDDSRHGGETFTKVVKDLCAAAESVKREVEGDTPAPKKKSYEIAFAAFERLDKKETLQFMDMLSNKYFDLLNDAVERVGISTTRLPRGKQGE